MFVFLDGRHLFSFSGKEEKRLLFFFVESHAVIFVLFGGLIGVALGYFILGKYG